MVVHLLKMSVGTDDVADLARWQKKRAIDRKAEGGPKRPFHRTRHMPKRADEILSGGSIYWIIKGRIRARQRIVAIELLENTEGEKRCRLDLDPKLVRVVPQPARPMQGWRYLKVEDAPPDLDAATGSDTPLPEKMVEELRDLGLL